MAARGVFPIRGEGGVLRNRPILARGDPCVILQKKTVFYKKRIVGLICIYFIAEVK